jgi:hypothetical protein
MAAMGGYYEDTVMQSAAAATGDGTAMQLRQPGSGQGTTATFQITGISGDTITWEATLNGSTWVAVMVKNLTTNTEATTATANGLYRFVCHGLEKVRARISTYSAGTITVLGRQAA